jgi:hypothetical protein
MIFDLRDESDSIPPSEIEIARETITKKNKLIVFKKKIFRNCPGGTPASSPAIHGREQTKQIPRPSATPVAQASKVQASRWDARFTLLFAAMNGRAKVKRPAGTNAENLFLEFYRFRHKQPI